MYKREVIKVGANNQTSEKTQEQEVRWTETRGEISNKIKQETRK